MSAAVLLGRRFDVPRWVTWLALLGCALLLNGVIPPSQSPDENSHLARAYLLSRGHIFLDRDPAGSGGAIDEGLLQFTDLFHDVGAGGKLDSTLVNGIVPYIRWSGVESRRVYAGTGYYFPAIYIPQAVAIWVGRHLGLSVPDTYYLTRVTVFVVTVAIVAWALTLTPSGFGALSLLVMPMVLFQAVSATIDGMSLALCMLAISSFLSLLRDEKTAGGVRRFVVLCVAVFVLSASRAHALPMVLLPFLVAWHRTNKVYLLGSILVLASTLAWTLFALLTVNDTRIVREVTSGSVLRYYMVRPVQFGTLVMDTLFEKWKYYWHTFVGTLGYLNIYLPPWYHRVAGAALLVLTILSVKLRNTFIHEGLARWVLGLAAVSSCLLVFVALLVTWTPFPSNTIDGVQGRYFHIPALLLAYALSGVAERPSWRTAVAMAIFGIFTLLSLFVMSAALQARYWLQERHYASHDMVSPEERAPLVLRHDVVLSGKYKSPGGGKLYSGAFNLGTYFGNSEGLLTLKVCSAAGCTAGSTDVSQVVDNEYAYIGFAHPLAVTQGETLQFYLTLIKSKNQVALWSHKGTDPALSVWLAGNPVDLVPDFRVAIQ
ncbi:DUF2142 domain-containing protein [Bordetella genomosp. 9]|uniref:DUF2142 domain-containing protein n=1 Tax=Bordetella genomosp. 9 TaxID=1416803 RepID=UPI0012FC0999|nr:DUF2142 domain-containing protein [Bordetella genomosp. 9]